MYYMIMLISFCILRNQFVDFRPKRRCKSRWKRRGPKRRRRGRRRPPPRRPAGPPRPWRWRWTRRRGYHRDLRRRRQRSRRGRRHPSRCGPRRRPNAPNSTSRRPRRWRDRCSSVTCRTSSSRRTNPPISSAGQKSA